MQGGCPCLYEVSLQGILLRDCTDHPADLHRPTNYLIPAAAGVAQLISPTNYFNCNYIYWLHNKCAPATVPTCNGPRLSEL